MLGWKMQEITFEDKVRASEKFLEWLKKKYPMPLAIIKTEYVKAPYLRGLKDVTGSVFQDGNIFTIVLAVERDVSRVVQSVAHEFKHIHQIVLENIMYHKINKKDEVAAWKFSAEEMKLYIKEIGTNWM
jgi:hypothetical protein